MTKFLCLPLRSLCLLRKQKKQNIVKELDWSRSEGGGGGGGGGEEEEEEDSGLFKAAMNEVDRRRKGGECNTSNKKCNTGLLKTLKRAVEVTR